MTRSSTLRRIVTLTEAEVAGKDQPKTGDGKKRSRPKIQKTEVNVQRKTGSWDWKAIGKLWGKKK